MNDEILHIITNKLSPINVLYSLLNNNQRLDQMARSINNIKFIDFSVELISMERILLLPYQHPNVSVIVFVAFSPNTLLLYFTGEYKSLLL